jgi:hypothetical protein
MIAGGTVKPKEIVKTFGVPMITVKRYVKLYRDHGSKGFHERKPRHSSAPVLKGEVLEQAQRSLDEGRSVPEVALPNSPTFQGDWFAPTSRDLRRRPPKTSGSTTGTTRSAVRHPWAAWGRLPDPPWMSMPLAWAQECSRRNPAASRLTNLAPAVSHGMNLKAAAVAAAKK